MLAEEIKLNHWAFKKLFQSYKVLSDYFENDMDALYRVSQTRFGLDHFEHKSDATASVWSGNALPTFASDQFTNLLPSLAELNFKLTKIIQETYEEVAELEHYRQTLILFVNNELSEDADFNDMAKSFICHFAQEEKDYFSSLEKGYKALLGKDLKDFRLR